MAVALPHRSTALILSPSYGSASHPPMKSLCLEAEKTRLWIYASKHQALNNEAVAWVYFLMLCFLVNTEWDGWNPAQLCLSVRVEGRGRCSTRGHGAGSIWGNVEVAETLVLICFWDTLGPWVVHGVLAHSCNCSEGFWETVCNICLIPLLLSLLCLGYTVSSPSSLRLFRGLAVAFTMWRALEFE